MRVALCLYGQPRNIESNLIEEGFFRWIIEPYEADVFAHAWISGSEEVFEASDWVDYQTKENLSAPDLILQKFNPKKYLFEKPKKFSLGEPCREKVKNLAYYSENNENNLLSQIYSISQSIKMLENSYDWVFLCRYDVLIDFLPRLENLKNNKLYLSNKYNHFCDNVVFGGYDAVKTQSFFSEIESFCSEVRLFTPEEFKRVSYEQKFSEIGRCTIDYGILRTTSRENLQN